MIALRRWPHRRGGFFAVRGRGRQRTDRRRDPSEPNMPESPRHEFADLGDVRLHYLIAGKGPAVVLLHGWPQTSHMWRDIIPGLAARYRVVAPDLRSRSPRPQAWARGRTPRNRPFMPGSAVLRS